MARITRGGGASFEWGWHTILGVPGRNSMLGWCKFLGEVAQNPGVGCTNSQGGCREFLVGGWREILGGGWREIVGGLAQIPSGVARNPSGGGRYS